MAGKPIEFDEAGIKRNDAALARAWAEYARALPTVKVMIEGHWDPCDCERCQGIRAQERITLEGQS